MSESKSQHIVCPHCAQINRVTEGKEKTAKCGSCKEPLFDGHPANVDGNAFMKQINKSDVPVLVDVWAPWCGPCRIMGPEFEKAAHELEPQMRFVKLNSDEEQAISSRLGIRGIPTMLLMHHGREIGRVSGAMPSSQIVAWAKEQMASASTPA
ncbi:MAG: thioredoxin TrxC [Hyphomicrobiaceae bacterium]|nr:thioredoxin TrxC [Hyphomicrobiaceae bacterium]